MGQPRREEPESFSSSSRIGGRLHAVGRNADLIRANAIHETSFGSLETWDPGLISALDLMLNSRFPMFITWGREHRLFYNDAYEFVLVGKGNCLGKTCRSVFPEAWARLEPVLERVLRGDATYTEDCQLPLVRNSMLSETWWACGYSPVLDEHGEIGGVLGIVYETTRRLLAEQALWSSEAALRTITDMSPAMLWRSDADGRITWINQPLQTYLGLRRLEQFRFDEHLHPEDRERAQGVRKACKTQRRPYEDQLRIKCADGSYHWFLVRAQQIWDGDGDLASWCWSAVDIDDWRTAADALDQKGDVLLDVSSSESALVWTADVATRLVHGLKPQFRTAWALPEDGESLRWEEWVAAAHPDDQPYMLTAFDRVAAGETLQGKFRAVSSAGITRWFHATIFPVPGPNGVAQRIGGLLVDVTRKVDPRVYLIHPEDDDRNRLAHALTREGFKVRAFGDTGEFDRVSGDLMPGVVILMAQENFTAVLASGSALRLHGPRLPWIAIGPFEGRLDKVVQLMKLGAANVLTPDASPEAISAAARAALPSSPDKDAPRRPTGAYQKIAELSRRERQVLEGLASGGTNKTIALALSLSPRTVETYRAQLMDRLGVRSLAELLRLAAEASAQSPEGKG